MCPIVDRKPFSSFLASNYLSIHHSLTTLGKEWKWNECRIVTVFKNEWKAAWYMVEETTIKVDERLIVYNVKCINQFLYSNRLLQVK